MTDRKLVHTCTIPIRWGDMDAYGHVNNTVYFRYMEQARVEWCEQLGVTVGPSSEVSPVIINASCTFLAPMNYPGEVEVKTFVGPLGRSSIPTYVEMRLVGEDTLYAEGAAKIVWMDVGTGKSAPTPDFVRQAVESA